MAKSVHQRFWSTHKAVSVPDWLYPMLRSVRIDRDEERELFRRWRELGDKSALDKIILSNTPAMLQLASKYSGHGIAIEDLLNDAVIGAIGAAQTFDVSHADGARFLTFALYSMWAQIEGAIGDLKGAVRYTRSSAEYAALFRKGTKAAPIQIAVSLDEPVDTSVEGGASRGDMLADSAPNPEEAVTANDVGTRRSKLIADCVNELPERLATIIRRRKLADVPASLRELSTQLGVTRERVRQLEAMAMTQLEGKLRSRDVNESSVDVWLG